MRIKHWLKIGAENLSRNDLRDYLKEVKASGKDPLTLVNVATHDHGVETKFFYRFDNEVKTWVGYAYKPGNGVKKPLEAGTNSEIVRSGWMDENLILNSHIAGHLRDTSYNEELGCTEAWLVTPVSIPKTKVSMTNERKALATNRLSANAF